MKRTAETKKSRKISFNTAITYIYKLREFAVQQAEERALLIIRREADGSADAQKTLCTEALERLDGVEKYIRSPLGHKTVSSGEAADG